MDIAKWCTRIIQWTFAALFVIVPFILTSVNYELFEYNKMMVTYAATVIIVAAWIIKMASEREIRITRTPLDIPIAVFFISQLIASIFSMDPHVSWFGYYSRFNGGMLSIISYILLYYAFVSNWTNLSNLIKIILATALVVSLYGLLEHFGFSTSCLLFTGKFDVSCWVQDVQNRVFATLGQPNWLAAYLVALLPVSLAFAVKKSFKNLEFWVWMVVSVVFFATLLFTKSRSGLIAAAVSDVVFWGILLLSLSFPRKRESIIDKKQVILPFLLVHIAFAVTVFFFGTNVDALDKFVTWESVQHQLQTTKVAAKPSTAAPVKTDTLLSTGGTESGVIRQYVWQGAITAWQSSVKTFLIGTGTETFAFAFYQFKPQAHNLTSEWDFLYNKAHNEYLNYLATTGILGLGSYLLFIGAFIVWFLKIQSSEFRVQNESKHDRESSILHSKFLILNSLFAGWISILITNFFGFSVVIMQLFLFLFLAMVMVSVRHEGTYTKSLKVSPSLLKTIYGIALVLGIILLYFLGRLWEADTLYAKGYQLHRFGKVMDAKNSLSGAIEQNPTEPIYYDEDSIILAELAAASLDARDATGAAILAKQSLAESDIAIGISPNNVIFWKTRTKIFAAFSSFDGAFTTAAIESLKHAYTLSPTDPKIPYTLAVLYGRLAPPDTTKAIEAVKTSIQLKPNYRDAYALLVFYYKDTKRPDLEKQIIQEYLAKVDPQDKEFLQTLQTL